MGLVGVVLPDDLERELRNFLPKRKGVLSAFVTEAIKEKLEKEKMKKLTEEGL